MAAVLRILGWKANGLRCPDHSVDLRDASEHPHRVSLVQMPNGTGKTTTLELLRAALSGSAENKGAWTRERVRGFGPPGAGGSGRFEVALLLNGKRTTIEMLFDFDLGSVQYATTYIQGRQERFFRPPDFARFLNEKMVPFYVFDGELAHSLLNPAKTDADEVVELLFQLKMLQTFKGKVMEYWEQQTERAGAREERGLSRYSNLLRRLKVRLGELEIDRDALASKARTLRQSHKEQSEAFAESIAREENVRRSHAEARLDLQSAETALRDHSQATLDWMTRPQALSPVLAEAIYDLKVGLDRVKLPASAAREFFDELAAEAECVCGRPIDEAVRVAIRERSARYLGAEDVAALNVMKTAIETAVGTSRTVPHDELQSQIEQLNRAVEHKQNCKNDLEEIEQQAGKGNPAVEAAREELHRLEGAIQQTERELARFEASDDGQNDDTTFCIASITRQIAGAEEEVSKITRTLDLKHRRDILCEVLENAYQQARRGITAEICAQSNARIGELMPYNDIRIERIDKSLHLQGKGGGSVGEQLSVAYGFLATLFGRADHKLPFVVDSPVGATDLAVRAKIGALVPLLSDQFIAFTISSEREGFVPALKEACQSPIQYLTIFRDVSPPLIERARTLGAQESANGFCVEDETFFNEFQDEEVKP